MSQQKIMLLAAALALGAVAAENEHDRGGHGHDQHQELAAGKSGLAGESLYHLESAWIDENGEIISLSRLHGKPVVMAMVYTSCEYACPLIVADMMKIYRGLPAEKRAGTQFVLVSFDPERDTPAAMRDYKKKHLPAEDWTMLSADEDDTLEFAVAMGVRYQPTEDGEFSHSSLIFILDQEGRELFRQSGAGNSPDAALATLDQIAY